MKISYLSPLVAVAIVLPSCSKSDGQRITDVLNQCATISQEAGAYSNPGDKADYVFRRSQLVNVSKCPADFRLAYQNHLNAWRDAVSALRNDTMGTAFLEGLVAGVVDDSRFIGQAQDQAYQATVRINSTYDTLTQIAARHGARIPVSIVGD